MYLCYVKTNDRRKIKKRTTQLETLMHQINRLHLKVQQKQCKSIEREVHDNQRLRRDQVGDHIYIRNTKAGSRVHLHRMLPSFVTTVSPKRSTEEQITDITTKLESITQYIKRLHLQVQQVHDKDSILQDK